MDAIIFLICAVVAVGCGLSVILQRQPIASALSLIGVMGSLAILYLMLGAEFLAAVQMIVYAGAIMVLFVFVIMLLNTGGEGGKKRRYFNFVLGVPALIALIGLLAWALQRVLPPGRPVIFGGFTEGGAQAIGRTLFTQYLLPFEITSLLVLIAIIGAMVLAKKEI
jgi:NADH-quinone oxidoreductase subunit J